MSTSHDFFAAIASGDSTQLSRLLEEQPELANERSPEGVSPVLWAYYTGNVDLVSLLLTVHPQLTIHDAAAMGDLERLRSLLASDPTLVRAYTNDGFTPLHYVAFFNGSTDLASALLEAGAEVDAVARNGQKVTPLHSAAPYGRRAITKLLLAHGANPNARQEGDETPLMEVARIGDAELVDTLLSYGADPTLRNDKGRTAADCAQEAGHTALAETLRSKMGSV